MKLTEVKSGKIEIKESKKELDIPEMNFLDLDPTHPNHQDRLDNLRIIQKTNPDLFKRILSWD